MEIMSGKGSLLFICGAWLAFQPVLRASPVQAIGTAVSDGAIRVNGFPVPSGVVLYSGDRITTGSTSAASIYLVSGDKLALGPATATRISAAGKQFILRLDRGKVAVAGATDAPIVVWAGGIRVESEQANGSYQVSSAGSSFDVRGRSGLTMVTGVNRTVSVSAGSLMKAVVTRGKSSQKHGKILIFTLIAAAAAGAGAGLALAAPGPACVSPSELTCP